MMARSTTVYRRSKLLCNPYINVYNKLLKKFKDAWRKFLLQAKNSVNIIFVNSYSQNI